MNPNNHNITQHTSAFSELETAYLRLRDQEGRLYTDELVRSLPEHSSDASLNKEWAIRKESMHKLISYLNQDTTEQELLELGCGNGWLSHAISKLEHINVMGVDINREELAQADRVFSRSNLSFEYGDIFSSTFSTRKYHKIIIAAAVQYFPDFHLLINRLMDLLFPKGEIHIIDSPFYDASGSISAKQRTHQYYKRMGAEAMIPYYHHHEWKVLKPYNYRIIKPSLLKKIQNKAKGIANPFVWVVIEKTSSGV